MAICHSSGIGETKTYSPGFGFRVAGVFYFRFEVNLKSLSIEKNFFRNFFENQENDMIYMIRNDKISVKDNQI